jgi:FixJ family two-component response regulator
MRRRLQLYLAGNCGSKPMTTPGYVIMIVDDDISIRRAARRLIKSHGFAVETFGSAEDFLASEQVKQTACMILDIQMPGLNGLELQQRLGALGYQIPIIFITALDDEGARAQALNAGALAYLVKPFDDVDLLNCINQALRPETVDHRRPATRH